eukprot:300381-Prymnesium_polylepis.1
MCIRDRLYTDCCTPHTLHQRLLRLRTMCPCNVAAATSAEVLVEGDPSQKLVLRTSRTHTKRMSSEPAENGTPKRARPGRRA